MIRLRSRRTVRPTSYGDHFRAPDRALVAAAPENEYVGGGRDGRRTGGPCQCDLRPERQTFSDEVEGCAAIARLRDRQSQDFNCSSHTLNSVERSCTISSAGSIAFITSRALRRGGPSSRGAPSVLPIRLSHKPCSTSSAATFSAKRARSPSPSKT